MTPEQEQIAESLIAEMKRQKGAINWKPFRDTNSIDAMDMTVVVKALREKEIIENFHGDTTVIRLTERNGWPFIGFEAQRHLDQKEKETKSTIETLTIKQLKGDIFQLKYWYWILIINAVASVIIALVVKRLTE